MENKIIQRYPIGFKFVGCGFVFEVIRFLPQFRFEHYVTKVIKAPKEHQHEMGFESTTTGKVIDHCLEVDDQVEAKSY